VSDKPNSEKTWNQLTPEQVNHFFTKCAKRADDLSEAANAVWMEFAKYLFAANAGAAAGLFLLPDSSGQRWYLVAFSLFCLGVFSVGVAWFAGWSWYHSLSDGWTRDFNTLMRGEMTFGDLDSRNRTRHRSPLAWWSRIGLVVSFALLLAGGVTAGIAYWGNPPAQSRSPHSQPIHGTP
jgi:hypothetical protein